MAPPGSRLPRALQTIRWLRGHHRALDRGHRRHGDVFAVDLAARAVQGPGAGEGRWVILADPEDVRRVFTADPAQVLAGQTNRFLEHLVGPRSILVLDEPAHMAQRRVLLPPLHGDRVRAYGELIADVTAAEVARWPRGEPFALWPRMQAITLEVIARAVFGVSAGPRLDRLQVLLRDMLDRMTSPRWLAAQLVRARVVGERGNGGSARAMLDPVDEFLYEEIRRRRLEADLEARDDILSLLLGARREDGAGLTDRELRDQLVTLLVAGHESTATSLSWAFERLLRHPAALERVREEALSDRDEYADAVVKETLRVRPVLTMVLRQLAMPMRLGGHELPAGTWVAPCGYLVHRRPDVYPEPDRFRPERFLERPPGTYTWLPFGGGVRRCLGAAFAQQEMRQVLRTVLARVDLRAPELEREAIASRFITLAPARGARVVVARERPVGRPARPAAAVAT